MPSLCNYRQLVLVDADDGRLSLFKEHQKYLSEIPPNSKWCLFWNDLTLPVYTNLKRTLRAYSQIHFCPSYYQRPDNSLNSDLLTFLDQLAFNFSFVLLVHGDKQPYSKVVQRAKSQYGEAKVEVHKISECSSQHLSPILALLAKQNDEYRTHQIDQGLVSNGKSKFKHRSSSINQWTDSIGGMPYGLEELTYFKKLIKRKQKMLDIYFYNYCPGKNSGLQPDLNGDSDVEQDESDHLTATFGRISSATQQFISYEVCTEPRGNELQGTDQTEEYPLLGEQTAATSNNRTVSKLGKSQKAPQQQRAQTTKKEHLPVSETVSCSGCAREFKDWSAQKSHFLAKHSKSTTRQRASQQQALVQATRGSMDYQSTAMANWYHYGLFGRGSAPVIGTFSNPSRTMYSQTMFSQDASAMVKKEQNTKMQVHPIVPVTIKSPKPKQNHAVVLPQQSKTINPRNNLTSHSLPSSPYISNFENQAIPNDQIFMKYPISSSTRPPEPTAHRTHLVYKKKPLIPTKNTTGDRAEYSRDNRYLPNPWREPVTYSDKLNTPSAGKQNASWLSTTAIPPSALFDSTMPTEGPVKTFPCTRCTKKYKSARDRLDHFIKTHADAFLPAARDAQVPVIESRSCWCCEKKFKSPGSQISHFIDKHAQTIVNIAGDPSDVLQNHIKIAQQRMEAAKLKVTGVGISLSCSHCIMKFKSQAALNIHFQMKHSKSSTELFSSQGGTATPSKPVTIQCGAATAAHPKSAHVPDYHVSLHYETLVEETQHESKAHGYTSDDAEKRQPDSAVSQACEPAIYSETEHGVTSTQPLHSTVNVFSTSSHNPIDMVREQTRIKETRDKYADQLLFCSQCTKKFQSIAHIKQHFDREHTSSTSSSASATTEREKHQLMDQALFTQADSMIQSRPENIGPRSCPSQPCLEKSTSATTNERHFIRKHTDPTSCFIPTSKVTVNKSMTVIKDVGKTFPCTRCTKKYKSARDRLDHFNKTHADAFLPAARDIQVPVIESRSCWCCEKKFKSPGSQISHFIDKHAQAIVNIAGDPSDVLQNHIKIAQQRMMRAKTTSDSTRLPPSNWRESKEFKGAVAHSLYFGAQRSEFTLNQASNVANHHEDKIESGKNKASILHSSDMLSQQGLLNADCADLSNLQHVERHPSVATKLTGNAASERVLKIPVSERPASGDRYPSEPVEPTDIFEHLNMGTTTTRVHGDASRHVLNDQGIIPCPRARSSPIVYMRLKRTRKQLRITPGRTNRCPFKDCQSEIVDYQFEELWSHTMIEHSDASLKLECCDPTITYNLEEYKKHLESVDHESE